MAFHVCSCLMKIKSQHLPSHTVLPCCPNTYSPAQPSLAVPILILPHSPLSQPSLAALLTVMVQYCEPTFTGQYVSWQSFSPRKLKVSLIRTLVHRALLICSDCALDKEIAKIKSIFGSNGYPDRIVNATIANKIKYFTEPKPFGPKKCPAYIRLPWIGTGHESPR